MKRLSLTGIVFCLILLGFVGCMGIRVYSALTVETVTDCRVIETVDQMRFSGNGNQSLSKMHYIVVTDKETFVIHSSWLNGKFNNSDLFYRIKKDSVYSFRVAGIGKGPFTDYRNILDMYQEPGNFLRPRDVRVRR